MTNNQSPGSQQQPELFTFYISKPPADDGQAFLNQASNEAITARLREHAKSKLERVEWKVRTLYSGEKRVKLSGLIAYRLNGDGSTGFPLPGTFHGDN